MSFDLTQLLQDTVGGALTNYATEQLGESADVAAKGVSMAIPALLGGLLKNSGDSSKMTELFNLITGPNISSDVSQIAPNMLEQGRGLLDTVLGGSEGLSQVLSEKTGMSLGSMGSLLAAALPMVLGTLRSHIQTNNLTQPQFANLLDEQKGFLAKLLDGDFLGALGLGALGMTVGGAVTGAVSGATDVVSGAADAATEAASAVTDTVSDVIAPVAGGMSSWAIFAASSIATVLLASFCTGKTPAPADTTQAATTTEAVSNNADANTASSASSASDNAASASADAASVKYIDGVLSVYFDTGKTNFDTVLAKTVAAEMVEMGKSGKKLAVSGFNDPRGNAKLNAELSKNRAKSVKEFLIAQGVPADNVEMVKPEETTGDSGSDAENRRVDVRVQP